MELSRLWADLRNVTLFCPCFDDYACIMCQLDSLGFKDLLVSSHLVASWLPSSKSEGSFGVTIAKFASGAAEEQVVG